MGEERREEEMSYTVLSQHSPESPWGSQGCPCLGPQTPSPIQLFGSDGGFLHHHSLRARQPPQGIGTIDVYQMLR